MGDVLGSLFGGGSAPTYAESKQSPESTMTESQKAMQQYLTNIGKLGYEQGMKYFDPQLQKRNASFYDAMTNAIQTGNSVRPADINATVAQTMQQQPAETTTQFAPNENIEQAMAYTDAQKKATGVMGNNGPSLASGNITDPQNAAILALRQGNITPEQIEAYRRQKQAADDAALLAKMKEAK